MPFENNLIYHKFYKIRQLVFQFSYHLGLNFLYIQSPLHILPRNPSLGCEAKYAKDFVYTENLNLNDKKTEIPIGVSCRTCDRLDCSQRAFPPLHKKFDVDIDTRGVSVYVKTDK